MPRKSELDLNRAALDEEALKRDLLGRYLHEISKTPLLDARREVELSKIIEAGLYAAHLLSEDKWPDWVQRRELERMVVDGHKARGLFLSANLRLVVSIARRYVASDLPMLDLIQEGNLDLVDSSGDFTWDCPAGAHSATAGAYDRGYQPDAEY